MTTLNYLFITVSHFVASLTLAPLQITMALFWFFFFPYAKSYAMLFISDDAFLAQAATLQNIMNGSSRLIFGILFDKWGFKVIFSFPQGG